MVAASGPARDGRARRRPSGAALRASGVELTFRGQRPVSALDGLSLDVAPRRGRRAHRPQRLRQEHAPARPVRPAAPDAAASRSTARPVTGPDPRVGFVFQEPRLLAWRSAEDNVGFPLELAGRRGRRARTPARRSCSASSGAAEVARGQAVDALGRHAPAGRHRPRARPRARGPPARRAVQRPRRPDPRAPQRGAPGPVGPPRDHDRARHPQHPRGRVPRRPRRRPVAAPGPGRRRRSASTCRDRAGSTPSTPRTPPSWPRGSASTSSRTASRERGRAHPRPDRGRPRPATARAPPRRWLELLGPDRRQPRRVRPRLAGDRLRHAATRRSSCPGR